ncbi:MAG: phage tail protein [Clostridia bacterium]
MANHGVNISQRATSLATPSVSKSAVPFVIGIAPIQCVKSPAAAGRPVLCTSYQEAVEKIGYSSDWTKYTLCEFLYSHFVLFGMQPVIFLNLLDPSTMNKAVIAADMTVTDHKIKLEIEAIDDAALVVKASGGSGTAYVKGTDYDVYYSGENLIVEAKSGGSCYGVTSLNIAYKKVTPESVDAGAVATGLENIELCMTTLGVIPDLICAPGFSDNTSVAAAMGAKAAGIGGMFRAKALVDISTAASGGADEYSKVVPLKNSHVFTDPNQIVCWPLLKLGSHTFHFSTQQAGLMARTDQDYGCPFASPSNKGLKCDAMVVAAGTEVNLTMTQANALNAGGVVTALNFMGDWVSWGNYTACYPGNTDVKDTFICVSRMFDWVANTLIRTFWSKLDKPMNRRFIDSILDTCNIWLNGLVGSGYLLGAHVVMLDVENPMSNLMAGIIRLHIYMTPPSPAQEIDFTLEYDASYATSALS